MVKLLIIADDFTGALDTGVKFAACGAETRVVTDRSYSFGNVNEAVQVLVVDAETRHLEPDEAYQVVYDITKSACRIGIPHIYKKTDSALRGNIGSELKAVLDASGEAALHFIPAFPKMNRTTREGVHYIEEIPVEQSIFGTDPFEPVTCSYIPDLIHLQTDVHVSVSGCADKEMANGPEIVVYNADTDQTVMEIGTWLSEREQLHIMAGCAGFASALPTLLNLEGRRKDIQEFKKHFLVACGSVNPITRSQLDYAERHGFTRLRMTPEQKLKPGYMESPAGKSLIRAWKDICLSQTRCILDTNDPQERHATLEYARKHGLSMEEVRVRISTTLGYVVKELVEAGVDSTMLITGGDTLMGFMNQIGCCEMAPICEMAPGTVLSEFELHQKKYEVISKSGGFGGEDLMVNLANIILGEKEEKIVC